jgi:hypothetical protein
MAFTNIYDNSFPPDTQLANLLGLDLRNLRLDVQERMGAISGLDASKPPFGTDAQPTKWNGVLFFATDTGNIYQWNNPAWTNVTSNFTTKSAALKAVNQVVHTGTTTLDTIYTLTVPANVIGVTGRVRMTLQFNEILTTTDSMIISFGSTTIASFSLNNTFFPGYCRISIEGGNTGVTNAQRWDGWVSFSKTGSTIPLMNTETGAVDTTSPVVVTIQFQNGNSSSSQTFDFFTIEFF